MPQRLIFCYELWWRKRVSGEREGGPCGRSGEAVAKWLLGLWEESKSQNIYINTWIKIIKTKGQSNEPAQLQINLESLLWYKQNEAKFIALPKVLAGSVCSP
jgi:hypothetical protein